MFRLATTRRRNSQSGYILIVVIFAVTLAIIALAAAVPAIKTQIRREREDELIHRGHQYARAIQLYYRKFGRYPGSLDDLENTNNLRFLRKKYVDPITGKDEWRLIHYGEATVKPIPAYLRNNGVGGGARPAGATGGTPAAGLATGVGGSQGVGAGATSASSISSRIPGSSIGGGAIVGVASTSDKEGLKEIDGKTKYSDWEFVYDPALDPTSRGTGAAPVNNTSPGRRPSPGSRGR